MSGTPFDTVMLDGCMDRLRKGDTQAANELLTAASHRLEKLARKMLNQFPVVGRWEQPEDVLQNSLLKLNEALKSVRPANTREFFALAATQIRRVLLDLARHYQGPRGLGKNYDSWAPGSTDSAGSARLETPDKKDSCDWDLDTWAAFHLAIEQLPPAEREVINLKFYHGWQQKQIAELFQVAEKTIQRWYNSAKERLVDLLGKDFVMPDEEPSGKTGR